MNSSSTNESLSEILNRLNQEQALIMVPSTVLVILTMFVGIIGNAVTCYVYGFRLRMTPTYLFVVMLAIVDLITSVVITPARIVQNVLPLKTTWDSMCKSHMVLTVFTGLATCGFLLAIAVDRYRKLCCPFKTQISMLGAKVITLLVCLFCAIQGGIVTLYYGSVRKPTTFANVYGHSCSAKITKTVNYYQLGFFAFYLLVTIFTIVSLTVIYSIIIHTMKKEIVQKNKTVIVAPPTKAEHLRQRLSNVVLHDLSSTSSNDSTTITNCEGNNTIDEKDTDIEENVSSTSSAQPTSSSSGVSSSSPCSSSLGGGRAPTTTTTDPKSYYPTRKTKTLAKNETRTQSLKRAEENVKRLNRTTVTMMMITCVFVIASIPSISTMMVNAAVKAEQKMGTTVAVLYWLARHTFYISSCLNPVIYGYRNPNFMDEVKLLFKRFR